MRPALVCPSDRTKWRLLFSEGNLAIYAGASLTVAGLWCMKAGIKPGLSFHPPGAAALTLMFRPRFALLAIALITSAYSLPHNQIASAPLNWMLLGIVPVTTALSIHWVSHRNLPRNVFVYIFVSAFFAAGASMTATGMATTCFHAMAITYPVEYLLIEYLPYYTLMAWGEAMITSMLVTVMVLWKPEWVGSFFDEDYQIVPEPSATSQTPLTSHGVRQGSRRLPLDEAYGSRAVQAQERSAISPLDIQ